MELLSVIASRRHRWRPHLARVLRASLISVIVTRSIQAVAEERPDDSSPGAAPVALTLAEAEQNALRFQPTLRQAHGLTDAAAGRVEEARSGYLPQVTGTAIYQRTTGNFAPRPGGLPKTLTTDTTGTMTTMTPTMMTSTAPTWSDTLFNSFNFGLTASQLIYDFGQTSGRWRAAAASRDAAVANEVLTEEQALLAVRRAYFQMGAQKDLVTVAESTVKNLEKHLHQIEAFVGAGIRPEIDLAQARTDLANAKVQLVSTANNYAVARAQLNQAMGVITGAWYELADNALPLIAGEDGALGALVDKALGARPELVNIERQRTAQTLTVSALRGGFGPSLSATAGANEAGIQLDQLIPNWYVGLALTWPILQGGLTVGQIHEAQGTLESLTAQEEVLRLQVRVDVEQGQLAVRAAKSSITATEEALVNARDLLRLAEARYANGIGSVIELGDAQVAFTNAEAQEVQARYGLSSARAQLLSALGVR